ncbi:MAG: adenylate/guanylate cyclase domain-containing response regulator, partial [Chloroflexales bacterium]|nr:adenylate/guanylate cyclase domain-containing response regulator [Chloroflexales bacterium]
MQCVPAPPPITILIVDDEPFNIAILEQELEDFGYRTLSAADGRSALEQVAATPPDLVLLDIMMPVMDGFAVLERLKADPETRDIPVVVISAVTDIASVARGIAMGAADYLPKPFDPTLLQARVGACLEQKRLRDGERAYLRQVALMTEAAAAVQRGDFAPEQLAPVAGRADALGNLARVFQTMVDEVRAREQRLLRQIEQLSQDIEEQSQAACETATAYLPMDRRLALAEGRELAPWARGAALFADISGFTALTEALARELGPQRGAEELTRQLNRVFGALVEVLHRHGGCAITFSGDAITCWFDDPGPPLAAQTGAPRPPGSPARPPATLRAIACALAIQAAMPGVGTIATAGGASFSIALKVAVAAGTVRRCLVGDPAVQRLETMAGRALDELARGEHLARPGEGLAAATAARGCADALADVGREPLQHAGGVAAVAAEQVTRIGLLHRADLARVQVVDFDPGQGVEHGPELGDARRGHQEQAVGKRRGRGRERSTFYLSRANVEMRARAQGFLVVKAAFLRLDLVGASRLGPDAE